MGEQNKLVTGMLIGAALGAAVSLFDRKTREKTFSQVKECSQKVWNYSKNPSELIDNFSNKISVTRQKIEEVTEDISFIAERVNEIKQSSDKLLGSTNVEEEKGRG